MKHIQHSVRLDIALDEVLKRHAKAKNISTYSLLQHCVRAGLSTLSGGENIDAVVTQLSIQIGSINTRLNYLERLCERSLYVSCAAYSYARVATSGQRIDEAKLNEEINSAFNRQLKRAGGSDET